MTNYIPSYIAKRRVGILRTIAVYHFARCRNRFDCLTVLAMVAAFIRHGIVAAVAVTVVGSIVSVIGEIAIGEDKNW